MKYKNLFFDLDDTIWAFSQNARDTFEEVYQKYSFDRYFDSFDHYYTLYQQRNTELWIEYGEGKITKDELNSQRFFYPLQALALPFVPLLLILRFPIIWPGYGILAIFAPLLLFSGMQIHLGHQGKRGLALSILIGYLLLLLFLPVVGMIRSTI